MTWRSYRFSCSSAMLVFLAAIPTEASAGTVSGEVIEAAPPNDPIAGARMTLFDAPLTVFREARTDALGGYSIADVVPGSYQLGCAAPGFGYLERTVVVGAGPSSEDFSAGPEVESGSWDVIGTTAPEFLDATDIAFLLPDGRLFYCHDTTDPILFDPVSTAKSFPAGSPSEQGCMNGTLLSDGRMILVGGQNTSDPGDFRNAVPWVKTFAPGGGVGWDLLDDLQHDPGRWYPGLVRLADGSLLAMGGGQAPDASRTATAERFDLPTETWSYTGSMLNPTEFPPAALLFTGQVLATWWPPQLYDPQTGQWSATGNFNQPNRGWPGHSDHSLVVLEDGRALVLGVLSGPDQNTGMGEIYDPTSETWSLTSNPGLVRFQAEVVQLPDGHVLVAGGETEDPAPPVPDVLGIVRWSDLYDPVTDQWRRVADMNDFREYHAVTLLIPDGRVISTGGTRIKFQVGPTSADIEAYSPPYLFRGVRPRIETISSTTPARGSAVTLDISPDTQLTSVVLTGLQSTTHWVDGGIPRRLVLPVEQTGSAAEASLPTDPNVLPLGHYMLFAMVDDIPSEAIVVRVTPAAEIPALGRTESVAIGLLVVGLAGALLVRRSYGPLYGRGRAARS